MPIREVPTNGPSVIFSSRTCGKCTASTVVSHDMVLPMKSAWYRTRAPGARAGSSTSTRFTTCIHSALRCGSNITPAMAAGDAAISISALTSIIQYVYHPSAYGLRHTASGLRLTLTLTAYGLRLTAYGFGFGFGFGLQLVA